MAPRNTGWHSECLLAKGSHGLALALALGPEVATHTAKAWAALGILDLGIWSAEVSPVSTPVIHRRPPESKTSVVLRFFFYTFPSNLHLTTDLYV